MELVERVDLTQRPQVHALPYLGEHRQVLRPEPVQVEQRDRAGRPREQLVVDLLGLVREPVAQHVGRHVGLEQPLAPLGQLLALMLDHHAVAPRVAVDLVVHALGHPLGVAHRPVDLLVGDQAIAGHVRRRGQFVAGVAHDEVVFQADEEQRAPGVALPAGPAAQLIIHAPALVLPAAENIEAAKFGHPFPVGLVTALDSVRRSALRAGGRILGAAAEPDVHAPAGHLGRHGHRAVRTGLGDDRGFLVVVLGVEHHAGHTCRDQTLRERLGLLDIEGADQHRATTLVAFRDQRGQRLVLFRAGGVDPVRLVLPDRGRVGRDHRDFELEVFAQLIAHVHGGRGHAAQVRVQPDVGLDRDGAQHLALGAGVQAFLGLDRGVQAVRPAPALGHSAPHLIHQLHRAVADDVVDVAFEQRPRVQRHVDGGELADVLVVVEVDAAEPLLDRLQALRGHRDAATVVGRLVVAPGHEPSDQGSRGVDRVLLAGHGAGQHHGHPCLVDEDRVRLVHDRGGERGLHPVGVVGDQLVAKVVKARLVDRHIGHVVGVGLPPLLRR